MTKAIFYFQSSKPIGFLIEGHAEYAEAGKDIVCSSITTAVFTSLNLITSILKSNEYTLKEDERKGIIQFDLKGEHSFVDLIISNLLDILTSISKDYPKNLQVISQTIGGGNRAKI